MYRLNYIFSFFLLFVLLCPLTVGAVGPEKQTITNDLYSFILPADWDISRPGDVASDGITPFERNSEMFHHYNLTWQKKGKNKFFPDMYIRIESFSLLSRKPLSANDIANMKIESYKQIPYVKDVVVTEQKAKNGQRKYMITKMAATLDATSGYKYYKTREYSLVLKGLDIVHHVSITMHETVYQETPGIQCMVDEILNSFVVNEKFSSEKHEKTQTKKR